MAEEAGWMEGSGAVVVLTVATLILFWGLSTVCEERFVPALSVICDRFSIPDDVAGATLMAAGASSPEVFSSLISLFITHSSLGAGTVIGSEQFNLLGICAGSVLYARGGRLVLDRKIVAREATFYLISLVLLILTLTHETATFGKHEHVVVRGPAALALLASYGGYVYVCARFKPITAWLEGCWGGRRKAAAAKSPSSGQPMTAADRAILSRMRANHILCIEDEPEANFDEGDDDQRGGTYGGTYASVRSREEEEDVERPSLVRLHSTAKELVEALGLSSSAHEFDLVLDDPDEFGCYLFRSNRFYARARISKHAWELRWCLVRLGDLELRTFPDRDDAARDDVEFWTGTGARRYTVTELSTFDRRRGLIEMELVPVGKDSPDAFEPQVAFFLAPCRHVLDAFVERAARVVEPPAHDIPFPPPEQIARSSHSYHEGGEANRDAESLVAWPHKASLLERALHVLLFPPKLVIHLTIIDVRTRAEPTGFDAVKACLESVAWLAVMSFGMCYCCETIGDILGLSDAVIGITFSAVGTSLPNLISSMVVARQGLGNMAVSNALGSNTFNVLVGLGGPWLLFCLSHDGTYDGLPADDIVGPTLVLIATLAAFLLLLVFTGFVLRRIHGYLFIFAYLLFLVWAVGKEVLPASS